MVARSEETPPAHRSGEPVATKVRRIAEKARTEPSFKFTSLYHLMNEELGAKGTRDRTITSITIDDWIFNFGPDQFQYQLLLENGRVTRIESLGYGY